MFAHSFTPGGPDIEMLFLAVALLVLGVVFFFQKNVKPQVPVVLVLISLALGVGAFTIASG